MSKSTRMTPEQLRLMGLVETSPGVYTKKTINVKEVYDEISTKMLPPEAYSPDYFNELVETGMAVTKNGVFVKTKDAVKEYLFLVVKGEPTPQQRHRHHQVKGADFVTTYDPSSKVKKEFLKQCLPYKPNKPYEQPLRVDMVFYFSRPKSHYRSGKNAHLLKDNAPEYHITRPDSDNLAKLVKDALNKTFWKDDSLVCDLNIKKRYDHNNPRTETTITPI